MSGSEKSAGNNTQILRNTEPVSAHAVSIRVSAFWADKISLWFKQLEAQFMIAGITREATKFGYVVAHLEPKYVMEVEDIIDSPPENGQYEALEAALIKRLSDSSSMRVRKLLEGEEIGDRTPSQFLRHLDSTCFSWDAGKIVERVGRDIRPSTRNTSGKRQNRGRFTGYRYHSSERRVCATHKVRN